MSTDSKDSKLTDYRGYHIKNIQNHYIALLSDNLVNLISYIYEHREQSPYDKPEIRVALASQMILSSNKLVPHNLSAQIVRDIEQLRNDEQYLSQWKDPSLKRKTLMKELEMLRKHTEIDDTISLNLAPADSGKPESLDDFDLQSSMSTLNVSAQLPLTKHGENMCRIM